MDDITIEAARTPTDEVRDLIAELDRTLAVEYLPEQRHGLALEALFQANIRFFVARLDGVAVGCGGVAAFAAFDAFAEVKRMYVRESARGRGVARALLARIESVTSQSGLHVLRLETGERQVAAIRLYEGAGFRRCDAFGDYLSLSPQATATSVFLGKRLAASG